MKELTDRQLEVLDYITAAIRERGFPPTIREIGEALDIRSTNGVNDHLKALERKGFIDRSASKSRAMMVTATPAGRPPGDIRPVPARAAASLNERAGGGRAMLSIPILGRIAAGNPIEAIEQADEHVQIDPSLVHTRGAAPIFALRVQGDSMIGDGIFDGDLIFVRRQEEARQGEIVAVMVDDAATVKRYHREGTRVRLDPSNPLMRPIYVDGTDGREIAILGKVVGVYRQLN